MRLHPPLHILHRSRSRQLATHASPFQPSTIDNGYRLTPSPLQNPFTSDPVYQRVLTWYLPPSIYNSISPQLHHFASEAISPLITTWIAAAESHPPTVKQYDSWGSRLPLDKLTTSSGWNQLGAWGAAAGVVAHGYEATHGPYRRIVQHAFNYIFGASSAVRSCPVSMTSGAARLLGKLLPGLPAAHPFHEVYARLISRTNPWVSAQWMTERPGGSDVQNSETVAIYSPLASEESEHGSLEEGDYLLRGFKWFCSASDCDVALILARTEAGAPLSLFLAPTRLSVKDASGTQTQVTNGIRIHRLKTKLGTRPLPTAEVQLHDTRAHLVGPLGRGIATIATLLNVTRTHNVFVALSCTRRGLDIAKSFARARTTLDQPLWTLPMHLRLLAGLELKHRAALHLGFFTTALLSHADNGHPPASALADERAPPLPPIGVPTQTLLRLLTATSKATICKLAASTLQESQEALGGVGYLDEPLDVETNISRLYRDTAANMTWEGTTNVLASEVVRFMCAGAGEEGNLGVVDEWVKESLRGVRDGALREALAAAWDVLSGRFEMGRRGEEGLGEALAVGRELMFSFAWVVSGLLLARDAQRLSGGRDNEPGSGGGSEYETGNGSTRDYEDEGSDAIAAECARRWILRGQGGYGEWVLPEVTAAARQTATATRVKEGTETDTEPETEHQRRNWDCRIVWGCDLPADAATGFRPLKAQAQAPAADAKL